MKLKSRKRNPSGYRVSFWNLDLKIIFKQRDEVWSDSKKDYCVYIWCRHGVVYYIGEGLFRSTCWWKDRPFDHKNDTVSSIIDSHWKCEIIASGLTKKECCILEAYLLKIAQRNLTEKGQYMWDGKSLINKQREYTYRGRSYEELFKEYLNLDGNNCWETLRRKINNN